jgi:hypothetical protein
MPKKKPVDDIWTGILSDRVTKASEGLLSIKLALRRHLKQNHDLRVEIDDLYRRYRKFARETNEFLEQYED